MKERKGSDWDLPEKMQSQSTGMQNQNIGMQNQNAGMQKSVRKESVRQSREAYLALALFDIAASNLAYGFGLWLRFDMQYMKIPARYLDTFIQMIPIQAVLILVLFAVFRLYRSIWRYAGIEELEYIITATGIAAVLHILVTKLFFQRMPITYYLVGWLLEFLLLSGIRYSVRFFSRFGGEDWLVNLQLYEQAERAVFISDALYIYRKRAVHSVSAKFDLNRAEAVVWVADYERKMLESMMGKNGWETLRCCQAIYLVHIIKILQNKSCQLPLKEKVAYVKSLKASEGFALLGETKCFQTPWLENACIWMYRNHMEFFLYLMISLILKVRGNL